MITSEQHSDTPLTQRGEKILAAAQKLFLIHGYDNTSLEMIINESGGSRRSIYSEFGNKEGLLMAVIKSHITTQLDVLSSLDYQKPVDAALKEVCERFVEGLLSEAIVSLFRIVIQQVVKIPELGQLIYQRGPLKGVTPLADYLEYLTEQGQLNIDDKHYAAQMLIEMCKGRLHTQAILLAHTNISRDEIKQHVEKAVDLFIKAFQVETN